MHGLTKLVTSLPPGPPHVRLSCNVTLCCTIFSVVWRTSFLRHIENEVCCSLQFVQNVPVTVQTLESLGDFKYLLAHVYNPLREALMVEVLMVLDTIFCSHLQWDVELHRMERCCVAPYMQAFVFDYNVRAPCLNSFRGTKKQ